MKVHFTSESIGDYKSQCALILMDDALTFDEKKEQVNRVRRECMSKYAFYSPQMRQLDDFIRNEIRRGKSRLSRAVG